MSWLDKVSWLQQLQRTATNDSNDGVVLDQHAVATAELRLSKPQHYRPQQDERRLLGHPADARFDALGQVSRSDDATVEILSPHQLEADAALQRSYLTPLTTEIAKRGAETLATFTASSYLQGRIEITVGDRKIANSANADAPIPPGPFRMAVTLDTPTGAIVAANQLARVADELPRTPELLLDRQTLVEAFTNAHRLRDDFPDLRPDVQFVNQFTATTPLIVLQVDAEPLFLVYKNRKNYAFCFNPAQVQTIPTGFQSIPADKPHAALAQAVKACLFHLSRPQAEQNAERLAALAAKTPSFAPLADAVATAARSLPNGSDDAINRAFISRIPEVALEFALVPAIDAPIMSHLLRRLSSSHAVRAYHHLPSLQTALAQTPETAFADVRTATALFADQAIQTNNWLYANHRDDCKSHGLMFEGR